MNKSILAIIGIILTVIVLALFEPAIVSSNNLSNIARQAAFLGIFSLAQTNTLLTKGLDLSQGGLAGFVMVTVALLSNYMGVPLSFLVGIILASTIGLINGLIISYIKVSAFVVTLGMGFFLQGLGLYLCNGTAVNNVAKGFDFIGWAEVFSIPLVTIVLGFFSFCLWVFYNKSVTGKKLLAIGSNEAAAFAVGLKVKKLKTMSYIMCAALTAIGAIILGSKLNIGHPMEASNIALESVAAAVIGGVSLFGGRGNVFGVVLGALFVTLISNFLNLFNVSSYVQQMFIGLIIIIAIIIDKSRSNEK